MADGYSRATGRVGACLTSTGPGAANNCGAVLEAIGASSEVLRMLEPHTPYRKRVTAVDGIPSVLHQAFADLRTQRPRPALVEVPVDLQSAVAEITVEPAGENPPAEPTPETIAQAAELLCGAHRPVL